MRLEKTVKVICFILFVLVLFGVPLYFSQKILTGSFYANGEAYSKGDGHLFEENLKLGLFVSIVDQLFWTAIISFILFFSLDKVARTFAFRVVLTIFVVVLIAISFIYGKRLTYYSTDYHSFCRSLDFITTWTSRMLGLLLSFVIVNIGEVMLKIRSTNC